MTQAGATPRLLLSALRVATGVGGFAAPGLAARMLALEPGPPSAYLVRLFAARNVAMGTGLLIAPAAARPLLWRVGICADALDVLAALLAMRAGKDRTSASVDAGASLLAAGLGLAGLRADRRVTR
jgi:hypothetical protein